MKERLRHKKRGIRSQEGTDDCGERRDEGESADWRMMEKLTSILIKFEFCFLFLEGLF